MPDHPPGSAAPLPQHATAIRAAAILGGLAVAAGAFGAHALQDQLEPRDLATFEVAVRYQMYHALTLLLCGVWQRFDPGARLGLAVHGFLWGTVVFAGTLYLLVLTDTRWLGAVTPLGGVGMIVGWLGLLRATRTAARAR